MGNEEKTEYWSPSDEKKKSDGEHLKAVYPWEVEVEIEQELGKIKLDPAVFDIDNWF